LLQQFGATSYVTTIESTLRRLSGKLDAVEAALNQLGGDTSGVTAAMSALANSVNGVASTATSADFATVQAAINGLGPGIGAVEGAFGSLNAAGSRLTQTVAGIQADALALQPAVEALCTAVPTVCP